MAKRSTMSNRQRLQRAILKYRKATKRAVNRLAVQTVRNIQGSMGSASPSPKGTPPAVRTGALRRSIMFSTHDWANRYFAKVGSNLVYARIHELGGVIRPKKGEFLKFAIGGKWRTRRKTFTSSRSGGSVTDITSHWKPTTTKSSRSGGSVTTGQFIRTRMVTIPPRPYLRPGLEKTKSQIHQILKGVFMELG